MPNLLDRDGEVRYIEGFVPSLEADRCLECLRGELAWGGERLVIAGRTIEVPRRVCWYGDPAAHYRYSGVDHAPLPWTATLRLLKARVEAYCDWEFNGVLCNLYRDGRDSMGWHADNEPELGPAPRIASLSFGAERRFELRHQATRNTLCLDLGHGGLLLMAGLAQRHWRHRIPKQPGLGSPRINLTFRTILSRRSE